jgi:hypothetical protein
MAHADPVRIRAHYLITRVEASMDAAVRKTLSNHESTRLKTSTAVRA